jgi:ABC-type amino acid transport substrate-binding protein
MDPEHTDSFVDVVVPVAYTFPSSGKLLAMMFVLFAGWLSGYQVPATGYPGLVSAGVASFFGSLFAAIPFLLDTFQIPSDLFQLFVIADNVVGGRFGSLVASVHMLGLVLLSASGVSGLLRFRLVPLLRYAAVTVGLTLTVFLGIRFSFEAMGREYRGYQHFIERGLLDPITDTRDLESPPAEIPVVDLSVPTLERIRERGRLRVGWVRDRLPFAFRNDSAALVGYDIEMAHHLARDLGVGLEFVKTEYGDTAALLDAGYLDVVMSGTPLTTDTLGQFSFPEPYLDETLAFIVRDHRRDSFSSRDAVKALPKPRLMVPNAPYYVAKIRRYLPNAEITVSDSPRSFFAAEEGRYDALVLTAERGSAWSLIYPAFAVAVPQPDILRVPLAYPVALGNERMVEFVTYWLELKRRDGTLDELYDHWILGRTTEKKEPRWSVIRNVLGWVD